MTNIGTYHIPALLNQTIDLLNIRPGHRYIDATLGGGGHSEEIVKRGGTLLGIDQDPEALSFASEKLKQACPGFTPPIFAKGNFAKIFQIAKQNTFDQVSGILFDLGVSSHQLDTPSRGFSFTNEGELDMRMDPDLGVTAKDLLAVLSEKQLTKLFLTYGEEKSARSYARAICQYRTSSPIQTVTQLAQIIVKQTPSSQRFGRIHPATKVFQALRIAVNDELNSLKEALPQAVELLVKEGRLVVISFHSLEEAIVKDFFSESQEKKLLKILTKKPITPSSEEIKINPRCRSAKLRGAQKV